MAMPMMMMLMMMRFMALMAKLAPIATMKMITPMMGKMTGRLMRGIMVAMMIVLMVFQRTWHDCNPWIGVLTVFQSWRPGTELPWTRRTAEPNCWGCCTAVCSFARHPFLRLGCRARKPAATLGAWFSPAS